MALTTKKLDWGRANAVGTVHNARGWSAACKVPVDAVEVRVDAMERPPQSADLQRFGRPAIVTVRDFREGGAIPLPADVRAELYLELMDVAAAVDIEAANLESLGGVVAAAQARGVAVIASFHDFEGLPTRRRVLSACRRALDAGATCVKLAAVIKTPLDLARLIELFDAMPAPRAAMGMGGALGRASRVALAAAGSALNYGWLASPQVPGQWPAARMVRLLEELND